MTADRKYFIFRVDLGDQNAERNLQQELEHAGVTVDHKFGSIPIDAEGHCQILRGVATDSIVQRLKRDLDIDAFADVPVSTSRRENSHGGPKNHHAQRARMAA